MRKCFACLVTTVLTLGVVGVAGASVPAGDKPPVTLEGDVNNKGVGKVKSAAVELEADEFYFDKTFIKGAAGKTVGVTITNEGNAPHTFTIDAQGIDEEIQPGDSIDIDVKVPKNGKAANFYCRFHVASGMQGAFFSKKGGGAGGTTTKTSGDGGGSGY